MQVDLELLRHSTLLPDLIVSQMSDHRTNERTPRSLSVTMESCTRRDISGAFTTTKINGTTFAVQEHDAFKEEPLIYVKLHPRAPIIILSDTGTGEPSEKHAHGMPHYVFGIGALHRAEILRAIQPSALFLFYSMKQQQDSYRRETRELDSA